MKAKHAEAKRKLGTLSARKKAADARRKLQEVVPDVHQKPDPFAKFDRMREKVEMAEAEAEALMELSAEAGETEPEFESVDELSIDAELEALKKKRQK
jgi:phage shock protein A